MRQRNREDVVEEFHVAFGSAVNAEWTPDLLFLRATLLTEELVEINLEFEQITRALEAGQTPTIEAKARLLKELSDLQYVLSGTAVDLGLPLQEAFNLVHKSNMSKAGEDGRPLFRGDGKVLKGPNYKEPDLVKLFE